MPRKLTFSGISCVVAIGSSSRLMGGQIPNNFHAFGNKQYIIEVALIASPILLQQHCKMCNAAHVQHEYGSNNSLT